MHPNDVIHEYSPPRILFIPQYIAYKKIFYNYILQPKNINKKPKKSKEANKLDRHPPRPQHDAVRFMYNIGARAS